MKLKYAKYHEASLKLIQDVANAASINCAAIAVAISNSIHIPSTEVENPTTHFNLQLLPGIHGEISEWNENIVFNAKECVEYIRALWLVRYTAAFPVSNRIMAVSPALTFFESLMGVNLYVSEDFKKLLEEHKNAIVYLTLEAVATRAEN